MTAYEMRISDWSSDVCSSDLAVTALFGLAFLGIELYEFHHLIEIGAGPQRSAFLSSFFTLVGTHGLHVTFGIIWLVTLMFQLSKHGLIAANKRRVMRSDEHTSELQSLMRNSYAVFCLKQK